MTTKPADEKFRMTPDESVELGISLSRGARRLVRDLVRVREQHRLKRADVADEIGIHKSGVTRFEVQDGNPRLDTLLRYAHAVGADIAFHVEPVGGWHCADGEVVRRVNAWGTRPDSVLSSAGEERVQEQKYPFHLRRHLA